MTKGRKESAVAAAVRAYLSMRTDCFYWRSSVGGAHLNGFFVRFNEPGVGDFIGVQAQRVSYPPGAQMPLIGRFFAVETKREVGGKQSEAQARFQRNVEAHGGLYVLARSVEDVHQALGTPQVYVVKERRKRVIPR